MTVPARVKQPPKSTTWRPEAPPWRASCTACGGWIATVYGGGNSVEGRCFNWRAHPELSPDRKCPQYGKPQRIRKP